MTFKYCLISLDNFLRSATFFFTVFFFFSILMPHCTPWWDIKFLAIMDLIWNHLVDMVNCLSNCVIFGNFLNTFNKRKEEKWCIYRRLVANCLKLQFYNGSKLSVSSLVRHLVYTWMTYSPFKWVDKHSSEFLWKWPSIRAELKNCEKQPKEMTFKPGDLQDHFMSTKSGSLEAKYKGMKGGSRLQHNDICQWFCFVAVVIIFKSTNLPPDILKEIPACKNKFYLSFIWP